MANKKYSNESLDALWAGSEESLHLAIEILSREVPENQAGMFERDKEDENEPHLLEVQNGVGIINVKGPLVTNAGFFDRMFGGVTAYSDIREAVVAAAGREDVSQILLNIDSPGGSVNGITDVADLIKLVDTKVKPVTSFASGNAASGAYWLAASTRKIYATKTSIVGSIGVIATHFDKSEMLAQMGVKATVIRAGKYKALASPVEPLTETARAQLQAQADSIYQLFISHVASGRNVTTDLADKKMGQGREFIGQEAAGAGLIDGIESFDSVMSKLSSAEGIEKRKNTFQNQGSILQGHMQMPKALTEQDIAALASGIPLAASSEASAEPAVETPTPDLAAEAVTPEVTPEAAADEAAAEAPAAPAPDAGVIALLQAQVKDKDAQIVAQSIEMHALRNSTQAMQTTHKALLDIAVTSVNRMHVALGGSVIDLSSMTAEAVVAEHAKASATFKEKFKVGGVAAVDATESVRKGAAKDTPLQVARKSAVRFSTPGGK